MPYFVVRSARRFKVRAAESCQLLLRRFEIAFHDQFLGFKISGPSRANSVGDREQEETREGQMSELQASALMPMLGLRDLR